MNRTRITRLAFLIVFVCFLLSTFVSLGSLRLMADQNMQELSKALAARIYDTISSDLSEPIIAARTMAHDRFLHELLENEANLDVGEVIEQMSSYLSDIREGLDFESAFVVSARSLRYYSYNGLNKIIDWHADKRDQWYADFIDENREYGLQVDRDEVSQDAWTVFVDSRIEDSKGNLVGVCGVGVQMTGSEALFIDLENEYNVKIDLVDADGIIQVDTDEAKLYTPFPVKIKTSDGDEYVYQRNDRDSFVVTKFVEKLGWYLVVQSDVGGVRNRFINVIVLNIALCVVVMVILVLAIKIIVERTKALAHASFRDQTTMLLNRRAFEEEKERLLNTPFEEDFVYVTADINGLKTVNDTMGHAAGDELIKGAAQCLKDCFGAYGRIYRIGGDEFAAMLTINREELEAAIRRFEAMVGSWSGEQVKSLSVSCGYALSREHPSENITELSQISDEMMYAAKEEYYRTSGNDRRR